MDFERFYTLIEKLRDEVIGKPTWIEEKGVFEYLDESPSTVAVLKIIRAAHGVSALNILCYSGLFIDLGVIVRCINDCDAEVFFYLKTFRTIPTTYDILLMHFFAVQSIKIYQIVQMLCHRRRLELRWFVF